MTAAPELPAGPAPDGFHQAAVWFEARHLADQQRIARLESDLMRADLDRARARGLTLEAFRTTTYPQSED